jgi:hypothetical protein
MGEIDEAELTRAGQRGAVVEGMADDGKRTISGALLRRCCHELKDQIDARGLRLNNVIVTGALDLTGLVVPFPLRFEGCEFAALTWTGPPWRPAWTSPTRPPRSWPMIRAPVVDLRAVPGPAVPRLLTRAGRCPMTGGHAVGQASCAMMLYRSAGLIRLGYCRPCSRSSPA